MEIHIITAFPKFFETPFQESILKRAQEKEIVKYFIYDLRNYTTDKRKTIDDKPYGGGPGMVLMVEPIYKAVEEIKKNLTGKNFKTLLTSAKGEKYSQKLARDFSELDALILIAGHYEGVDERVAEHIVDMEISIGEYVLTGGELACAIIADSVTRLLPGVLGNETSLERESYDNADYKEHGHYTRPASFVTTEGKVWEVPDVLRSGNHAEIEKYRLEK